VRDGGGRPGRAGGSSSSSTASLPLDGEEFNFDFTIQEPQIGRIKCGGGFRKKTFACVGEVLFTVDTLSVVVCSEVWLVNKQIRMTAI
jgi:hypothetical protein